MSYTREQWCLDFLAAIGNSNPSKNTLDWCIAWTYIETSPPGAKYNLLNTTEWMPNSTDFNSVGVKNFATYADGIKANATCIQNGFYPNLLLALKTNLEYQLGFSSGGVVTQNIYQELNTWCGNCNYGDKIWGLTGFGTNDLFPGERNIQQINMNMRKQFDDIWAFSGVTLGTGIQNACWIALSQHNTNFGEPLKAELKTVDWEGNPIARQSGDQGVRCEWQYNTNKAHFYDYTNKEILVV